MSAQSLKWKTEQWAIDTLSLVAALNQIQKLHVDSGAPAEQERIICSATVHQRELEGPAAFPVDLEIELRSTNRDATAVDQIFAAIEAALLPPAVTDVQAYFSYLIFFPESMDSRADRGDNSRIRSRTYPFKALPSN